MYKRQILSSSKRSFIRWARDREVHQSFQQFHIVRKDHVIGTTLGLVSTRFPDIIALPPDVLLQENDQLLSLIHIYIGLLIRDNHYIFYNYESKVQHPAKYALKY